MRRYQTTFSLGDIDHSVPALEEAASICVQWATTRNRAKAETLPLTESVSVLRGDFGEVRTIRIDSDDMAWWGIESRVPDADEPDTLTWVTELVLQQKVGAAPIVTCTNSLISYDLVRPAFRASTQPRIVADLIERFGGTKQYRLSTKAQKVTGDNLKQFAEILLAANRTFPVVFVSARNYDDKPCMDADRVAFQLAGTAHVFVGVNRFPSLQMRNYLPQYLGCWDGAVRIYWPRLSPYDNPAEHPHWRATDMAEIDEKRPAGFTEYLLGFVSHVATHTNDREACTLVDLERIRHQQERAALRAALDQASLNDYERMYALAEEEIAELKTANEQLRKERESLAASLFRAESKAVNLETALHRKSSGKPIDPPDGPPESVQKAIEAAKTEFSERLEFALNSKSEPDSPYANLEEVATAFLWLATTYHDAKTGAAPNKSLDQSLRDACGWFFQSHQSVTTVGQYREWYETKVGGRKVELLAHIGRGKSKDPRETIRVAFAWDKESRKVVIGYIGQHQETRKT